MSKRNLFIIGGIVVFLALAAGFWFGAPIVFAMSAKAEAKQMIVASLPDRTSVEFRNLKATYIKLVCGEIRVTNGRGGYTEFEQFVWQKTGGIELKPVVTPGEELTPAQKIDIEFWHERYSDCGKYGR